MIEPVSDDLTMPINPRLRANRLMMISGALPRVALSKPPRVGPRYSARASVASPIKPGERNDRQRRHDEHQDRVELQPIETDRDRDEDEQPVQVQGTTPRVLDVVRQCRVDDEPSAGDGSWISIMRPFAIRRCRPSDGSNFITPASSGSGLPGSVDWTLAHFLRSGYLGKIK